MRKQKIADRVKRNGEVTSDFAGTRGNINRVYTRKKIRILYSVLK
jgi:hypothetical protein